MSQEIALWRTVIQRALADAMQELTHTPPSRERRAWISARDDARAWLSEGGEDYLEVCHLAGLDPARLETHIRGLQKIGWHIGVRTEEPAPRREIQQYFDPGLIEKRYRALAVPVTRSSSTAARRNGCKNERTHGTNETV